MNSLSDLDVKSSLKVVLPHANVNSLDLISLLSEARDFWNLRKYEN